MSEATMDDVPQLRRVMEHMHGIIGRIRSENLDMVEYGLALALASRSAHRTISNFGGPDAERYERLGKILQELGEEEP